MLGSGALGSGFQTPANRVRPDGLRKACPSCGNQAFEMWAGSGNAPDGTTHQGHPISPQLPIDGHTPYTFPGLWDCWVLSLWKCEPGCGRAWYTYLFQQGSSGMQPGTMQVHPMYHTNPPATSTPTDPTMSFHGHEEGPFPAGNRNVRRSQRFRWSSLGSSLQHSNMLMAMIRDGPGIYGSGIYGSPPTPTNPYWSPTQVTSSEDSPLATGEADRRIMTSAPAPGSSSVDGMGSQPAQTQLNSASMSGRVTPSISSPSRPSSGVPSTPDAAGPSQMRNRSRTDLSLEGMDASRHLIPPRFKTWEAWMNYRNKRKNGACDDCAQKKCKCSHEVGAKPSALKKTKKGDDDMRE